MKMYDENEAADFILNAVGDCGLDREDVLDILCILYDYYDRNGDLDLDFGDDDDDFGDIDSEDEDISLTAAAIAAETDTDEATLVKIISAEHRYQDSLL